MHVLLLNPNTSADMTTHIVREARRHGWSGLELSAATATFGATVIASRVSYAIAAHAVLDTYARHAHSPAGAGGVDAVVLACFGDPGLEALREMVGVPVIGLLESALAEASDRPYGIITAGMAWGPMLDERIRATPHAPLSRGVFAIPTTGLDVTRDPDRFVDALQQAVDAACWSGAKSVILGGSALAGFGARLSTRARLIDPLAAAMAAARRCADASMGVGRQLAAVDPQPTTPKSDSLQGMSYRGLGPDLTQILKNL